MKIIKIKVLLIIALLGIFILFGTTNVKAVLQANGEEGATKNIDQWMLQIRQMQAPGGTFGLKDEINTSNLSSNNKNLDVHMQKNTEYGAMILLSASAYGNPNKIEDGDTTTGNSSGGTMKINNEWVAAGAGITESSIYKNAISRYKNEYSTSYFAKSGDAILNWHGSSTHTWITASERSGLLRSCSGSVFSYYGHWDRNPGLFSNSWYSRAAIVVGTGI